MGRSLLALPGAPLAIASAALFGANTPFAKPLLGDGVSPWLLAGLLYLGSGIGLSVVHRGRQLLVSQRRKRPFGVPRPTSLVALSPDARQQRRSG